MYKEREGRLCFPALLLQTCAAESLVGQRGWPRSSRVSRGKACQSWVTAMWKDSTSPLLFFTYYLTVMYTRFGPCSASFYCHHLPLWAAQPTYLLLWLFQHHFGNLNAKHVHATSNQWSCRKLLWQLLLRAVVYPTVCQYTCLFFPTLAWRRRLSSRDFHFFTLANRIHPFLYYSCFFVPLRVLNRINK